MSLTPHTLTPRAARHTQPAPAHRLVVGPPPGESAGAGRQRVTKVESSDGDLETEVRKPLRVRLRRGRHPPDHQGRLKADPVQRHAVREKLLRQRVQGAALRVVRLDVVAVDDPVRPAPAATPPPGRPSACRRWPRRGPSHRLRTSRHRQHARETARRTLPGDRTRRGRPGRPPPLSRRPRRQPAESASFAQVICAAPTAARPYFLLRLPEPSAANASRSTEGRRLRHLGSETPVQVT